MTTSNKYANFFELQRHYQRNSMMLYLLFVLAMMIHVLLALLVSLLIWQMAFGNVDEFGWFWIIILIPSYFIINVLYQYQKIIHNHDNLLKNIDAKRIFINISGIASSDSHRVIVANSVQQLQPHHRRYYEFAEQLAIACNITCPKLYVMNDKSVNAFVAGFDDNDMMLVMSEGALALDNESLYGLIGHEYGHILHGDAKLNVKMYVLMSGLSWLYDVADGLETFSQWRQTPKAKRYYIKNELGHKKEYIAVTGVGRLSIEFISLMIRLVGFLGMASSEWIKQHFNRQREYLADATSVQLTRSEGVAKLLTTLQKNPYLNKHKKHYTTHLSYFFFLNPNDEHDNNWRDKISHMGDTHPSNIERIHALKHRDYDAFAQMAIADLNKEQLQRTHDELMTWAVNDDITPMPYQIIQHTNDDSSSIDTKTNHNPIDIPIYDTPIEPSNDKIINGKLVVDEYWKKLGRLDEMIYPNQAKADVELQGITHVNANHVRKMHLPLIINRFLRNEKPLDEKSTHIHSPLFALYYGVLLCHDKYEINIYQAVNLCSLFGIANDEFYVHLDDELLTNIAKMDRRIDDGLLLIIYQRMRQDLTSDDKKSWLINDYQHLIHHLNNQSNHTKIHTNPLNALWRGVHLAILLSLFDDNSNFNNHPIVNHIREFTNQYAMSDSESVMMVLLVYLVFCHDIAHDKRIATIHRHIRLINHTLAIDENTLHELMIMADEFSVLDIAVLLNSYHHENTNITKQHLNTLHTALLVNGEFNELDYQILLALAYLWCGDDEWIPT